MTLPPANDDNIPVIRTYSLSLSYFRKPSLFDAFPLMAAYFAASLTKTVQSYVLIVNTVLVSCSCSNGSRKVRERFAKSSLVQPRTALEKHPNRIFRVPNVTSRKICLYILRASCKNIVCNSCQTSQNHQSAKKRETENERKKTEITKRSNHRRLRLFSKRIRYKSEDSSQTHL